MIAALSLELAPLDDAIDSVSLALRRDSGTATADTILEQLEAALRTNMRQVVPAFDDSAFQILIWPDGVRGAQLRRAQERAGLAAPEPDPVASDSLRRVLIAHGIWSCPAEGETYFDLSLDRLRDEASAFVTDAAREALRIRIREQVSPTGGDAAVGIPWDSLGDRLADTDRFLAAFPDAAARPVIEERRVWYLRAFLTGWSNTAVFARRTGILHPEVRASFERYLRTHDDTASAAVVREYLEMLVESQFRSTPAVVEFLRTRGGIPQH